MVKDAWVLRLKEEVAKEMHSEGEALYLCDDEGVDFLTDDLQIALIYPDKEEAIQELKEIDRILIELYGNDSIRNFGWENISKNFEFVEVELREVDSDG